MNVNVFAGLDVGHDAADVMAVFDDGIVLLELGQGDLVPEGNVLQGLDLDRFLAVGFGKGRSPSWISLTIYS